MGLMGIDIFGVSTIKESQVVSYVLLQSHVVTSSHVRLFKFQLIK